ncbi:MAG: HlyD family efflux transporter periplasmic adaptor subunit [Bryobacterales bacterium]|nr:HlyD family efflux transporter periplasmic adaptor subunit [Bryobacterales bacterium]
MSAITNPRPHPPAPVKPVPVVSPEPQPPQPGRRWIWIAGLLLLVGAAAGYFGWYKPRQEQAEKAAGAVTIKTARVTTGTVLRTLRLAGTTASREYVNVTAPIPRGPESGREMILLFLVPNGSRVKKGQLLAEIDSKSVEDHIDDIGDDIEKSDADIRKRKAEQSIDLENLNQTLRVAKAEWDKAKLDAKASEVRTVIDQELLKLAAEEAEARYKQATADVKYKQAGYAAELRILEITKIRHLRHKARHQNDLVKFKIFSPMEGLAVAQMIWRGSEYATYQQGDQVQAGSLFLKIVNPAKMQVDANVNQSESSQIRISQKANIHFDAFAGMTLPGHVYSIGAIAAGGWRQQFYIRNVPVKIAVDGADPRLIPDLSVGADVELERVENAIRVPLGAIFKDKDQDVVFVRNGAKFEPRPIKTGLASNTLVAVTSGVKDGEEIALERPQGL